MRRNGFIVFTIFFSVIAVTVTCNFLLFLHFFDLNETLIRQAAPVTFLNCVIWATIYCIIDSVRRYYTINLPIQRIKNGLKKVMNGDYSTRIDYVIGENSKNELDAIIVELNKMIQALSSVETLQSDFIANVSHEFKTPLTVIHNYATLLQNTNITNERRLEYSSEISEQTRKLSNLVSNILHLNRLENQQIYPNSRRYNLSEQLRECILEFESIWEEKQIEIVVDIEEDYFIEADAGLLEIVWDNLLSNALKFTPSHGQVTIKVYRQNYDVYVQIQDTGKGMSASVGKQIFQKFYQGDPSHATSGNGLGLALVKRVMDICKGEINVSSQLEKGSTFTVKLAMREENHGTK